MKFSDVARDREVEGDLMLGDLGDGLPFRAGAFDGAVSISALQWLCNADKSYHKPTKRLAKFFSSLYASLVSMIPNEICQQYVVRHHPVLSSWSNAIFVSSLPDCRAVERAQCFSFTLKILPRLK